MTREGWASQPIQAQESPHRQVTNRIVSPREFRCLEEQQEDLPRPSAHMVGLDVVFASIGGSVSEEEEAYSIDWGDNATDRRGGSGEELQHDFGLSVNDWTDDEDDGEDEDGDMGGGKEEEDPQHDEGSTGGSPVDDPQQELAVVLGVLQPHEPPGRQRHFEIGRAPAWDEDEDEQHDAVVVIAGEGETGFVKLSFWGEEGDTADKLVQGDDAGGCGGESDSNDGGDDGVRGDGKA